MLWSDEQRKKAAFPIVVTLSGISMLFSAEQPLKAKSPIVVTLFGISMLWSALQSPVFTTGYYSIFCE